MAKITHTQGQPVMKKLYQYIDALQQKSLPQEGESIEFVLNEELAVISDVVFVEGSDVYLGVDEHAFALLEAAGLMELADDPGFKGATGTALGGKPATPAAAAAAPAPSGATNPQAGAKPIQSGAGLRAAQQQAAAAGSPAPTPGTSKPVKATGALSTTMAQSTSGRYGTSTPPRAPTPKKTGGGAPANPQQAAVDAANAVQRGQMDKVAGQTPAAVPDVEAGKAGLAAGSPAAQAAQSTPAPQANALGVMPQAQVAGSPTATAQPAAAQSSTSKTPGLDSATTPQGQAVGGETVPTRGGPAVTGGFGQETNVTTDSPDQIARRGPMGTTLPDPATQRAQGEKNLQSIKNFLGIGNKPAATTPAPAGDQTAGGKTNADFLPGAAGGGAQTQAVPEPNIERPAATAQAPSTMAEDAEFARMLNLAGVRRG